MTTDNIVQRSALGWRPVKWGAFAILATATMIAFYVHESYVFRRSDPEWTHLAPMRWWLIPHIAAGATALFLGPLQFSSTIRRRTARVHRWLGRIYVGCVVLSSILSLYVVMRFEAPYNRWSMGSMGGLWLLCTLFAWFAALNRNFSQHRLWMARSYCLTFTFVTTRFIPDVLLPGLDYIGMTALYWALIVSSLLLPDLMLNGRTLLPVGQRPDRSQSR